MGLSLSMNLSLSLRQIMLCSCCGKELGKDNNEGPLLVLLDIQNGLDPKYRLCPTCFQYVDEMNWSPTYKRKWTILARKLVAKGARASFGPNVHVFTADKLEEAICKTLGIPIPPRPITPKEAESIKACEDLMNQLKGTNWQI